MMRLMVDGPLTGGRNMSVDQVLLQSAAESGVATLRLYRWQPATLSLGYFQNWASRSQHSSSRPCPVVRRASGGGAIVHDQELTYSLALPSSNRWSSQNRDLFDVVHQTLIQSLEQLGVAGCQVYQTQGKESRTAPFLCFLRRATGDVVLDGFKIIGSAQRRLENALLQHGSVLVQRSRFAPELPGVRDLVEGSDCSIENLVKIWPPQLAQQMEWTMEPATLTAAEESQTQEIATQQFENDLWNRKR